MISPPAGTRIWIACGPTDLRNGFDGLAGLVQTQLAEDALSSQLFVFRGRRGDRFKILWWSGDGLCLFAKRLESGRFVWPQAISGTAHLTSAQLVAHAHGSKRAAPSRSNGASRRSRRSTALRTCRRPSVSRAARPRQGADPRARAGAPSEGAGLSHKTVRLYAPSRRPRHGLTALEYPLRDRAVSVIQRGHLWFGNRKINLSVQCAPRSV